MDFNLRDEIKSTNFKALTVGEQTMASAFRNFAFPPDRTAPAPAYVRQMQPSVNYLGERATKLADALDAHVGASKAVQEIQDSLRQTAETAKNGSWKESASRVAGREVESARLAGVPLSKTTEELLREYNRTAGGVNGWTREVVENNRLRNISNFKTDLAAIATGLGSNYVIDKLDFSGAPVSMRTKGVEAVATPMMFLASRVGFLGKVYGIIGTHTALRMWDMIEYDRAK